MEFTHLFRVLKDASAEGREIEAFVTFATDAFVSDRKLTAAERTYILSSKQITRNSPYVTYFVSAKSLDGTDKNIRVEVFMENNLAFVYRLHRTTRKVGCDGLTVGKCGIIKHQLLYTDGTQILNMGYYDTLKKAAAAMRNDVAKSAGCGVRTLDKYAEANKETCKVDDMSACLNTENGCKVWKIDRIYTNGEEFLNFDDITESSSLSAKV